MICLGLYKAISALKKWYWFNTSGNRKEINLNKRDSTKRLFLALCACGTTNSHIVSHNGGIFFPIVGYNGGISPPQYITQWGNNFLHWITQWGNISPIISHNGGIFYHILPHNGGNIFPHCIPQQGGEYFPTFYYTMGEYFPTFYHTMWGILSHIASHNAEDIYVYSALYPKIQNNLLIVSIPRHI